MAQQSHCWAYICTKLIFKKTRTPVFIAALVTIAQTWKQPKCPSTDERIKTSLVAQMVKRLPAIREIQV